VVAEDSLSLAASTVEFTFKAARPFDKVTASAHMTRKRAGLSYRENL
jgi:hypothetical protein